jgi:hypothetical protein
MNEAELPLKVQVSIWREKALAGTMSEEELKRAIETLRNGRMTAVANSPKTRAASDKKAGAAAADDILGELGL